MSTFGFIGAGNMGGALAAAASKKLKAGELFISDPVLGEKTASALGGTAADNEYIAKHCDYIVLGVKPQIISSVCAQIGPLLKERTAPYTVISMAAGVNIESIRERLGVNSPIIRIMPNLPVSVGQGEVLYACSENVRDGAREQFSEVFSGAGLLTPLPEHLIDAGSAVSGCGPAFAEMFIEALADGGVACGLPRKLAMEAAAQTLLGSAELLLKTGRHPGEIKDAVCSPGGSTIMGVKALEDGGFRSSLINAVIAAYDKTKALGK